MEPTVKALETCAMTISTRMIGNVAVMRCKLWFSRMNTRLQLNATNASPQQIKPDRDMCTIHPSCRANNCCGIQTNNSKTEEFGVTISPSFLKFRAKKKIVLILFTMRSMPVTSLSASTTHDRTAEQLTTHFKVVQCASLEAKVATQRAQQRLPLVHTTLGGTLLPLYMPLSAIPV